MLPDRKAEGGFRRHRLLLIRMNAWSAARKDGDGRRLARPVYV
jgi:hypothetical protein